jgi:hypothetical protein
MNTLPRPRIHENHPAKLKAYRARKKQEREAARDLIAALGGLNAVNASPIGDALGALQPEQREALERLVSNSAQGEKLKQKAG